jgi:hypothetical protein
MAQAKLVLQRDKTHLIDARTQSFDFRGYRFADGRRWPRDKSLMKFKDVICAKTRRTAGRRLRAIIDDLNLRLGAGSPTSRTATARRSLRSMARYADACEACSAVGPGRRGLHAVTTNFLVEQGPLSLQRAHAVALSVPSLVRSPTGEPDAGRSTRPVGR